MILKVIGYGNPILRNQSKDIDFSYPDLNILIENMFETLKVSNAVGLSAPQIGLNINFKNSVDIEKLHNYWIFSLNLNPAKKRPKWIYFTGKIGTG